jgi:hypothetical protein
MVVYHATCRLELCEIRRKIGPDCGIGGITPMDLSLGRAFGRRTSFHFA